MVAEKTERQSLERERPTFWLQPDFPQELQRRVGDRFVVGVCQGAACLAREFRKEIVIELDGVGMALVLYATLCVTREPLMVSPLG